MRTTLCASCWRAVFLSAAASAIAVSAAVAGQSASKPGETRNKDLKVTVAGVQVSIDPATGKLRTPTPEESRALTAGLRRELGAQPVQPVNVTQTASGALMAELPEDTMETMVLRTHEDGTQTIECMSQAEATRLLEGEGAQAGPPAVVGAPRNATSASTPASTPIKPQEKE